MIRNLSSFKYYHNYTMKIFYLSVILFFCASFAKAQVNPLDTLGYRMSVVSNVKDVALVTGMPAAEQITLANFFQKAEDTINGAVNSGVTGAALEATQNQLIAQFQSILSAQELNLYRQQRPGSVYAKILTSGS